MYQYLSHFIQSLRFQIEEKKIKLKLDFVKGINMIPKLYYFGVPRQFDQNKLYRMLYDQCPKQLQEHAKQIRQQLAISFKTIPKIDFSQKPDNLLILIRAMKKFYRKYPQLPSPIILIDQINIYHSFIRQIQEYIKQFGYEQKYKTPTFTRKVYYATILSDIFKQIQQNFIAMYSSSLNIQQKQETLRSRIAYQFLNIFQFQKQKHFIKRYTQVSPKEGFFQIINLLRFEFRKRFIQNTKQIFEYSLSQESFQKFSKLKTQFLQLEKTKELEYLKLLNDQNIQNKIDDGQYAFINHVSHLSISLFFSLPQNAKIPIISQQQLPLQYNLLKYLKKIKNYSLAGVKHIFAKFCSNGTSNHSFMKLMILHQLRQSIKAKQYEQKMDFLSKQVKYKMNKEIMAKFQKKIELHEYFLDLNREYFFHEEKTIAFYQVPETLMDIIDSIFFRNIIANIQSTLLDFFRHNFQQNGTLCGELIDKSFARAVSQCNLMVKMGKQTFIIKNSHRNKRFFRHLLNPGKINNDKIPNYYTNKYFGQLLSSKELNQLKDGEYLGAAPQTKNQYLDQNQTAISTNSPSIDMLFFKRKEERSYEILTFDFTVGVLQPEGIKQRLIKLSKVRSFLIQIFKRNNQTIVHTHTFLCRKKTKQLIDKQNLSYIKAQAIVDIECMTSQKPNLSIEALFTALKFVKEQISKKQQKER